MHASTLIIGGCRSGKSSYALSLGEQAWGRRNLFVATAQPHDAEMALRIKRHQQERGDHWQTIETPLNLARVIETHGPGANVLLIDCLTLWISNLMTTHEEDGQVMAAVERLHDLILAPPCPVILVTNEVGGGIVPDNAMARRFRDLTGWCNQKVASACTRVVWMVAGIAVPIKTDR
jgi:adenosylcobinamide kinase/adenosylcobinamide-phosphate guanylyltransferase